MAENRRRHGQLKRLVLCALGDGHWHRPRQIAHVLPFRRRGQLHAYLLRLISSTLVERAFERGSDRYIYRLSEAGCRLLLGEHWQR